MKHKCGIKDSSAAPSLFILSLDPFSFLGLFILYNLTGRGNILYYNESSHF